ncbi:MAG: hypothetical protein R3B07_36425 [Polyangiaceae bacterium]
MKVFGYGDVVSEEFGLQKMREVSFEGTPDELRHVARFLIQKAEELEMRTFRISHKHIPPKGLEEEAATSSSSSGLKRSTRNRRGSRLLRSHPAEAAGDRSPLPQTPWKSP